jgi:hypothetical protein
MNSDGKPDIVTANNAGSPITNVSVSLGDGLGNFSSPTNFNAGSDTNRPMEVAIADVNLDGKPDILCANGSSGSATVSLLLNTAFQISLRHQDLLAARSPLREPISTLFQQTTS